MWFNRLTGFDEISPEQVKENIEINGMHLTSKVNGKTYQFGVLEIPTLADLVKQAPSIEKYAAQINVTEVVGDVQQMHKNPLNKNALFQAASQFNLLEMVGPDVTPEEGISIYEYDRTQGPACAIACGAGTIYRNYFVPLNGKVGQSASNQIDCLLLIGKALNNHELALWEMKNGYALVNQQGLLHINKQLAQLDISQIEFLKGKLKIGLQWYTEVTLHDTKQMVSQAYCSALPVAYSQIDAVYWERFARLILEATYEATLYAALINLERTGSNKVFLTLVGGGAFGNELTWILESLDKAISKFKKVPLAIKIVSYGQSNPDIQEFIKALKS